MTRSVAIDFETYYDDQISLTKIPTWRYVFHPDATPHTVSVYGDGIEYVGDPKDFDWYQLNDTELIIHNASFDGLILKRLRKEGIIPADFRQGRLVDTADMVSYLRFPRALGNAAEVLLDVRLDKGVRDRMKGKTRDMMDAEGWRKEMDQYALEDAKYTYILYEKYKDKWPESERRLSEITREAGWKGVRVDVEKANKSLDQLKFMLGEMERQIPWDWEGKKTAFLALKIREQARMDGIPEVPASFAKDSSDFAGWVIKYGEQFPWIKAIVNYNQVRWMIGKITTLLDGCDDNDIYHYDMKYFGADTGRWSAGSERGAEGRFSMHGLPKFPKFGVDLRSLLIPREGHKFIVWDFSQIEPRLIHWMTGNHELLRKIDEQKLSVYQAEAEVCGYGTWKDLKKEDPKLYSFVKAQYLGGQYQCSAGKFRMLAKKQADMDLTDEEAVEIIQRFRSNNPKIPAFWRQLQNLVRQSEQEKTDLVLTLPSGRDLTYFNVRYNTQEGGYVGEYRKGMTAYKIYGGSLTNNLIQGTGRDILGEAVLRLDQSEFGHPLWTVHDEGINEVPEDLAKPEELYKIVITRPEWAKNLPIDSEVVVSDCYVK